MATKTANKLTTVFMKPQTMIAYFVSLMQHWRLLQLKLFATLNSKKFPQPSSHSRNIFIQQILFSNLNIYAQLCASSSQINKARECSFARSICLILMINRDFLTAVYTIKLNWYLPNIYTVTASSISSNKLVICIIFRNDRKHSIIIFLS